MAMTPEWDEQESLHFIQFADTFVPDRQRQVQLMAALVPANAVNVVDLCCGKGDVVDHLLSVNASVNVVAMDKSSAMLDAAKLRLSRWGDRAKVAAFEFSSTDWFDVLINADAVTCSLALHHLTNDGKADLLRAIGRRLAPAGCFVLADMFVPTTPSATRLWGEEWNDVVRLQSLETFGDDRAFLEFQRLEWNHYLDPNPDEYDRPSSIIEHIDWLKAAGLTSIDIHYFRAGHGIVSATRK